MEILEFISSGYGYGDGDGSGYGSGNGRGSGYGSSIKSIKRNGCI